MMTRIMMCPATDIRGPTTAMVASCRRSERMHADALLDEKLPTFLLSTYEGSCSWPGKKAVIQSDDTLDNIRD